MKKNVVKIISIILMTAVILTLGVSIVSASGFIVSPSEIQATPSEASTSVQSMAGSILGVVQVVAVAVAIIMLIVLAIKYMTAAPNDKADIKKSAPIYVVGAVLIFAASGVLGIIQSFAENAIQ